MIGTGKEVSGFPVVWVGTKDGWYGSVDLNITMALRKALQQALIKVQNKSDSSNELACEVSSVLLEEKMPVSLSIPACEEKIQVRHPTERHGNIETEWKTDFSIRTRT